MWWDGGYVIIEGIGGKYCFMWIILLWGILEEYFFI